MAASSTDIWRTSEVDAKIANAHRFKVTIGVFPLGGWNKVSGMKFTCKPTPITQAGFNTYQTQLLGVPQWDPIVLSRVVFEDEWLLTYAYVREALLTPPTPVFLAPGGVSNYLSIHINNAWGDPIRKLLFYNCRPAGWSVDTLDTSKSAPAIEQLTLVHDGLFPDGNLDPDS